MISMNKVIVKKKKVSFNFIDAFLIIVIIAAAVLLAKIFISDGGVGVIGKTPIEYQVSVVGVREEFRNKVNIGDRVLDSVGLFEIGEVVDIKYDSYKYLIHDEINGKALAVDYPEHINITLIIRADATLENGFYYINGYQISVGTLVSLRVPSFNEQGYCTVIDEVIS